MERHLISKSSFIKSLQCLKQLYLYKYSYQLRDPLTSDQRVRFQKGHDFGKKARMLFPGGIDLSPASPFQYPRAVEATRDEIRKGTSTLYEACFQYNKVLVAMDILHFEENIGWKAYEVKSSGVITETYIMDAALQYWVISNSGTDLKDILIIYSKENTDISGGKEDKDLFQIVSVRESVLKMQDQINEKVELAIKTLESRKVPEVEVGNHCHIPYKCDFIGYCWGKGVSG